MNKQSFWAVVAGAVVAVFATTLVDVGLHMAHVFPSIHEPINDALALLATSYRAVIGLVVLAVPQSWVGGKLYEAPAPRPTASGHHRDRA